MKCTCGDEEELHVDNEGHCVVADCNCKEFEEQTELDKVMHRDEWQEPLNHFMSHFNPPNQWRNV